MKRLLSIVCMMVAIATGVWANVPPTDADGYYLLDSPEEWEAFATLVVTNPTANARMTADIDLGESQAMLGDSEHKDNPTYAYQGTFDGQGYTLTVHYTGTSQTAPFAMLQKATIRNIHVDGTINNTSGDRAVTITDAVSVVNYILGNPAEGFNIKAANVNNDFDDDDNPKITITDAVGIVSIILWSRNQ